MFDESFYLKLVNREFGWNIKLTELTNTQSRIVRRIEQYLGHKSNAIESKFSHFRPARYLSEKLDSLEERLSDSTLKRFERAFVKVNELL